MPSEQLAIGGVILFFSVCFWLVFRHKRHIRETWTQFARAHGLTLELGTYPSARGQIDGRLFEMGSSMGRKVNSVVEFMIKAGVKGEVPAGLVAGKRGMLQGAGPVQTGDPTFDGKIWVDCPDRAAATRYLTAPRRAALLRAADEGLVLVGPSELQGPVLVESRTGYKVKVEWFESRRTQIFDIAAQLDA